MTDKEKTALERMAKSKERLKSWLESASVLDALVTLRQLRLLLPYQSTHLGDLEAQIRAELKREPRSLT